MNQLDGVQWIDGSEEPVTLESDIKMILNLAGNCLINQHGDINRTAELLRDESKCEFIVVSDLFMTASAKFADILLPGISMFECENITMPWQYGNFLGFNNKVIEPLYEGRFEYDWFSEVADRLGLKEQFTCGRTASEWLEYLYKELKKQKQNCRIMRFLRSRRCSIIRSSQFGLLSKKNAAIRKRIRFLQRAERLRFFLRRSTGPSLKNLCRPFRATFRRWRERRILWQKSIRCS